jgi:hypothetical protein
MSLSGFPPTLTAPPEVLSNMVKAVSKVHMLCKSNTTATFNSTQKPQETISKEKGKNHNTQRQSRS